MEFLPVTPLGFGSVKKNAEIVIKLDVGENTLDSFFHPKNINSFDPGRNSVETFCHQKVKFYEKKCKLLIFKDILD